MELSKQVISLSLAKRLKELGVKQESQHYWWKLKEHSGTSAPSENYVMLSPEIDRRKVSDYTDRYPDAEIYAAFTVAELGEMLPKNENVVSMFFPNGRMQTCMQGNVENDEGIATRWGAAGQSIEGDTEAEARGLMLAYLIENKLI